MTTVTVKTSELDGAALDWAVAEAVEERVKVQPGIGHMIVVRFADTYQERYRPSADWSQGGPLVSQYHFEFDWLDSDWHGEPIEMFVARPYKLGREGVGETHLIAACRAIVAAKLGDTVEVPEVLL